MTLKHEIIEKMAIAEQFSHNAQYAGVARQAVADGYLSLDALFSALLIDAGETPPRNHKQKLDAVRAHFPDIFATRQEKSGNGWSYWGGIDWDDIEAFYREWLQSRYETFDIPASAARGRVATVISANHFVIRWLADKDGEDWYEVLRVVHRATYGYYDSKISEELARAHDYLFSEAEVHGEQIGRKLATKMASTTNFCGADIIAGDDVTRRLIEEDQALADHAAGVYVEFCRLMEKIRGQRAELIKAINPEMDDAEVFDQATEFMLSMKAKYHGERLADTGDTIARLIGTTLGRFDPPKSAGD